MSKTAIEMAKEAGLFTHKEVQPELQAFAELVRADERAKLAEQPAQDNTYAYAKSLAESLFKKHHAQEEHYASGRVVWEVCDSTIGVLTQIDNMVCTLVRPAEQPAQQEPVAWMQDSIELYVQDRPGASYTIPLYTTPQAQPAREPLTDAAYYNACLSYRHDFGLMSDEDRQKLVFEAKEWARAFGITKGNT